MHIETFFSSSSSLCFTPKLTARQRDLLIFSQSRWRCNFSTTWTIYRTFYNILLLLLLIHSKMSLIGIDHNNMLIDDNFIFTEIHFFCFAPGVFFHFSLLNCTAAGRSNNVLFLPLNDGVSVQQLAMQIYSGRSWVLNIVVVGCRRGRIVITKQHSLWTFRIIFCLSHPHVNDICSPATYVLVIRICRCIFSLNNITHHETMIESIQSSS